MPVSPASASITIWTENVENVVKQNPKVSEELYRTVLDVAGGPLPYYE